MNKVQKAVEEFAAGFACSQAVLSAFGQELGLDRITALKAACGLGAGMGRTGQICGAVSGAYLAIGLKHGRSKLEDLEARSKTYALVREFEKRFQRRHASVNCTVLMEGLDLGNPQDYEKATATGLFQKHCPKYVRSAVEILEEIL